MATTCPAGFDASRLHREVSAVYDRVARSPQGEYHFHRGLEFAATLLGYDREELRTLPGSTTERFAGVANPLRIASLAPGETVLDMGCGAGMDLLLAARRVGPGGRAIGVDPTPAMREAALGGARAAGLEAAVEVREGDVLSLPAGDGTVDVVLSNGVLNLSVDKRATLTEIRRVLRPGGRLLLGDVFLDRELKLDERSDIDLWAG